MKNKGFSLIEVLIAGALLTVVGLGVASLIKGQSQQLSTLRTYSSRDQLKAQLDYAVNSLASSFASVGGPNSTITIANSISANNGLLFHCLNGTNGANGCSANSWIDGAGVTRNSAPVPFYLISSSSQYLDAASALGGPDAQPVFYDRTGRRCTFAESGTTGNQNCYIRVRSYYAVTCPSLSQTCQRADKVMMGYVLDRALNIPVSELSPAISDIKITDSMKSQITIQNPLTTVRTCSPGFVNGINSDGTVNCGSPQALPTCPNGEVLTTDSTTGQTKCVKPIQGNRNGAPVNEQAKGICREGYTVSSINEDGSVFCVKRKCVRQGPYYLNGLNPTGHIPGPSGNVIQRDLVCNASSSGPLYQTGTLENVYVLGGTNWSSGSGGVCSINAGDISTLLSFYVRKVDEQNTTLFMKNNGYCPGPTCVSICAQYFYDCCYFDSN
jgi:hypothetical protein